MARLVATVLCLLLGVWGCVATLYDLTDDAKADQITTLPGIDSSSISFRHFSGYLNAGSGRYIHYWFIESLNDPSTDPVVFWTNGGPGCSGFIGLFEEHGPFSPQSDGTTLELNPYSWNAVANMLYFESPAGVGYSYATNTSDYYDGTDDMAAETNYNAIQSFFDRFPALRSSDFYITAESYGGHYIPTLAYQLVTENEDSSNTYINFKGFAVGNPYTDPSENLLGTYSALYGHSMISRPVWENIVAYCITAATQDIDKCYSYIDVAQGQIGAVDQYALDWDYCTSSSSSRNTQRKLMTKLIKKNQKKFLLNLKSSSATSEPLSKFDFHHHVEKSYAHKQKAASTMLVQTKSASAKKASRMSSSSSSSYTYDPCRDDYTSTYLNQDSVKTALNVNSSLTWSSCSDVVFDNWDYDSWAFSAETIYSYLVSKQSTLDLKMLVYSGDDDSVCGPIGTQWWIWNLGLNVTDSWSPWYYDQQVSGYVVKFDGLTYATVHTAGHEVPAMEPARGLQLFTMFLNGTLF